MITPSDFIHLPYTADLTDGGIAYAVRSLPYTYDRMGGSSFDRLRRIVAGVAVELAFRRYLHEQGVPFDVKGATPFTDPDRYDVSLGGHRCDIKSFLITYREQISALRSDPSLVLQAPALVPSDQHAREAHEEHDLYLFAFLGALLAASSQDLKRAIEHGQPVTMLFNLPEAWVRPRSWNPLGSLALKSEAQEPIVIELAGQDGARDFITRRIKLPPRTRLTIDDPFFSLSSIQSEQLPSARLGVHSPSKGETLVIQPHEWGNIRVYGLEILLTGYMARREFGNKASHVPPGSRVFQYDRTRAKNLAVPVADLHPLKDLFERVKVWGQKRD
jgi:hypothetical protein